MTKAEQTSQRITQLRHRVGLTQEQLGTRLGVSGQAVSKWENGDSLPDTTLLVSLAKALDCTTDYLLGADADGGVSCFMPLLEAGIRQLASNEKIDLAFRLFHLVDDVSYSHVKAELEDMKAPAPAAKLPFVHAGPEGITLW